jgi:hypothetical protein
MQGVWAAVLVLPRVYDGSKGTYGNLYSNLLDYCIVRLVLWSIRFGAKRVQATNCPLRNWTLSPFCAVSIPEGTYRTMHYVISAALIF